MRSKTRSHKWENVFIVYVLGKDSNLQLMKNCYKLLRKKKKNQGKMSQRNQYTEASLDGSCKTTQGPLTVSMNAVQVIDFVTHILS